jgi:hypothetical protein
MIELTLQFGFKTGVKGLAGTELLGVFSSVYFALQHEMEKDHEC